MQTASRKVVNAWAMYDWANSAYNLVITSTIFPTYYEAITRLEQNEVHFMGRKFVNTALYNYALAFAFLIVALISPILTSIADFKGNKKRFMQFFCYMGSAACIGLFFFKPVRGSGGSFFLPESSLNLGILFVIIACIGFWGSVVFYNSYLPDIAAEADRDRISAKGYTMGYIGSVILQMAAFVIVFKPEWFGIMNEFDKDFLPPRISFLMVGIWWLAFAQIPFALLPRPIPSGVKNSKNILTNGYKELRKVYSQVIKMPVLKRFLLAFFFWSVGVQTVFLAGTQFGAKELNLGTEKLIISILLMQLVAIPGAIYISKLSGKIGNIKTLLITVFIWVCICIAGYFIQTDIEFYLLVAVIGLVMGGIQSLSRSTYSKLMPETRDTASFFSFYDVTEKIALIPGLFFFGFVEELTKSMRNSVITLMVFFILGFIALLFTLIKQTNLEKKQMPNFET